MPRRRGRRAWLLLGGAAVAIGVGLWVAMGNLVNTTAVKDGAARAVKAALGRDLTIDGPIRILPGLNPSLTAEGITLSNPAGFTGPPMLRAGRLSASIDLLALLTGAVSIKTVELDDAELVLTRGTDGTPNWRITRPARPLYDRAADAPTGAATGAGGSGHGGRTSLDIGRVTLKGGHVTWVGVNGTATVLTITSATLHENGMQAPIFGKFSGSLGGVPLTATVQAGISERLLGAPVTALAGAWPLTVKVTAGTATATLDGGVNHPEDFRGYVFRLTANAPDLRPLAPALPGVLAQLPLHDVNLTTQLTDGSNEQFHTAGLSLFADDSDLTGLIPGLYLKRAQFSAPGPGQQAQLSIDGSFGGAPVRVNGTATQPDVLEASVPVPLALSAQAASASISARGTIPASWGATGLDLAVSVRAPSLSDLAPFALRPLPDVRDISLEGKLSDAGFKLRGLAVHDLVFTSSLGDLAGDVTAAWLPVPTLNGDLKAKSFNLDAAREAWAKFAAAAPVQAAPNTPLAPLPAMAPAAPAPALPAGTEPPPPRLIPDTPFDMSGLHGADADLALSAAALTVNGQTWHELDARLFANDGKLVLNPLRMRTPDGVLIGAVSLDAAATPPAAAVTLRSPNLSASGVANLLGLPGALSGNLQVDMELNAAGASPRAMAATLGGHLGVSMVDGGVTDALWQNALGDTLGQAGIPLTGGNTTVRCLALRLNFHRGQGRFDALALDTNRLELEGEGGIDLADESFALHLKPRLAVGGTGVAAPVSLTGAFTAPKAALDPVLGGKFSLQIGGDGPSDEKCIAALPVARGGQPGPLPAAAPAEGEKKRLKPKDFAEGAVSLERWATGLNRKGGRPPL